ncbi:MAG: RnfABCDGE type electron transport complex subunit A [Dehalococcoidia bacterium]|nr:MAG: RnfABCDGE type electron transport complex subunit A [Dehalococcoidia bacterium]
MNLSEFMTIAISAIFINNFILTRFLGLCPFMGVSKQTKPALGMGAAVIFVMTLSGFITWVVYRYLLVPFNLEYLRTIAFILVIAVFVQAVEMAMAKLSPALYRAMGIYLPLITTNCAVLGVTVLNVNMFFGKDMSTGLSFSASLLQAFCAGIGFALAMLLMSGIRERLDLTDVPKSLQGVPIAFIVASLMSMGFLGFSGFKF